MSASTPRFVDQIDMPFARVLPPADAVSSGDIAMWKEERGIDGDRITCLGFTTPESAPACGLELRDGSAAPTILSAQDADDEWKAAFAVPDSYVALRVETNEEHVTLEPELLLGDRWAAYMELGPEETIERLVVIDANDREVAIQIPRGSGDDEIDPLDFSTAVGIPR